MITDLQNTNSNWVYQSNKLIEASYTLTVMEQKLIRLLASMIKKDDDDFKEYEFKTKDLIKILNTSDSRFYRDIDNITDLIMQRIIKIKDINTKEFEKYHWVDICKYKNGILKLKINKELKPFYLSLDWYTKYQLKNIMQFKSTYSFRLYELLKQYESLGNRLITIDDLRLALDIDKKQYPKYANLKQKVISKAIEEVNKYTDLYVNSDFKEIKDGRKVTSIRFNITSKSTNNKKRSLNEIALTSLDLGQDPHEKALDLINQVQEIFTDHVITEHEANCILKDANNNIDLVSQCYKYSLTKSKVDNITGYVRTLVKGFNKPQESIKTDNFNNYPQRTYNFEDLERKLLGWDNIKNEDSDEQYQQEKINI